MADANAEYYDYYKVQGEDVKQLIASYADIAGKRSEIIRGMMEQVGAVGYCPDSGWGSKGTLLRSFVWEDTYQFPCPITVKGTDYMDGKRVIIARGKGNTKAGREYNKVLDAVVAEGNSKLKQLPSWQDYLIKHYGVMRCGIGACRPQGGCWMTETRCGVPYEGCDDTLVFSIPKKGEGLDKPVVIPDNFQKLTYGQFYDLTTRDEEGEE